MISDRRWYLTADGGVVEEGDPRAHTLLVGRGGHIHDARARKHGLAERQAAAQAERQAEAQAGGKAVPSPPADKALRAAPEDKAVKGPPQAK